VVDVIAAHLSRRFPAILAASLVLAAFARMAEGQ